MANDGRCACGCRIFFDKATRITCADGRAFNIPGIQISECVSCGSTVKIIGNDGERKTVIRFTHGKDAEKSLFLEALESSKVEHVKAPNSHYIVAEEGDLKDFERLGISRESVKL